MPTTGKYNQEKEVELIKKYQMTQDPMILRQLRTMFAGTIKDAIKKSNTYGLDPRSLDQKALVGFTAAIMNYNPTKGAKPSTHITTGIMGYLSNQNYALKNNTRLISANSELQTQIWATKNRLDSLGLDTSNENIIKELKKTSKKKVDNKIIENIQGMARTELTGDKLMGNSGDGEDITFTDVLNSEKMTTNQVLQQQETNQLLQDAFNNALTEQEKGLIRDRHPGVYDNRINTKASAWSYSAINNGYPSEHFAKQAYKNAMNKMQSYIKERTK